MLLTNVSFFIPTLFPKLFVFFFLNGSVPNIFLTVLLNQLSFSCVVVLNKMPLSFGTKFRILFLTAKVVHISSVDDLVGHLNKTTIL